MAYAMLMSIFTPIFAFFRHFFAATFTLLISLLFRKAITTPIAF